MDNLVSGNLADGGIAINDDGPLDPGAPTGHPGAPRPSFGDIVAANQVAGNLVGCGIVLSSYNRGAGVRDVTVAHNTLTGNPDKYPPVLVVRR